MAVMLRTDLTGLSGFTSHTNALLNCAVSEAAPGHVADAMTYFYILAMIMRNAAAVDVESADALRCHLTREVSS